MPLYEYLCEACGHRFEVIRKFSDSPLETCPKCGGIVHKQQSAPAFQFKGSGWYITDYARKDGVPASKSSDAPAVKDAPASSESPAKADAAPTVASPPSTKGDPPKSSS